MVSEAQPQSAAPEDIESTAELPMLDLEAYEAELEAQRVAGEDDSGPTLIQPGLSDTAIAADFANFEAEIAALGTDVERLRGLLLERDAAVAESRQRTSAAEAASAAAAARLAAAEAEIAVAREEREAFWQRNDSLDAELRAAQALTEELNAAAASQVARLAVLEQRLQAAERTAAWASADSAGARAQIAALQEALRTREARRGLWETLWREADAEVAASSASSGRLSGELEQALGRIALLERELAQSRSANEAARRELAEVAADREQISQRLTRAETALGTRSGELDAQRQRSDALAAQLRDSLQVTEARAHHLEVELSLKSARLDAQHAFEAGREEVAAPTEAPAAAAAPRSADVLPLEWPAPSQRVGRREPELLPEGAPRFLILSEGNSETVFRLARRTTIGRADDNDIAIARASISRHHAVILSGPRQTVIEDLNSTNGVLVNRQRVRETVLRDGDVVHIGKCRFRFSSRPRDSGKT